VEAQGLIFIAMILFWTYSHNIYIYIGISDDLNLILLDILVNWQMDAHLIQTTQIKQ
jgi:hypothetical protein